MNDWRYRPFGDLSVNLDSRRMPVKESDRRPGPYPYYGASGIVDYVDEYIFDGLHLLVAEDGENLRTRKLPIAFLADGKFWVNNHAHIVKGNDQADTRFLCYALMVADVASYLTGSTMPKLTQGNLNRIPIFTPGIHEQISIANILGSLDEKINLNCRMNETLEAKALAIFKDWFVDFGPARARAARQGLGKISAEFADIFPEIFNDDGIPRGWKTVPLDQIAEFLNGLALQKFPPTGVNDLPVIKIAELRSGVTPSSGKASAEVPHQYIVRDGDILFSWSGTLTHKFWTEGPGALNQHLFKVTPAEYPKWFVYLWIAHHMPEFQAIAASKATTMGHIQRHHLSQARVIIPSAPVMAAADSVLAPLTERMIANALENRTLASLRDLLLPKLMSGELRIRAAEKAVASAL